MTDASGMRPFILGISGSSSRISRTAQLVDLILGGLTHVDIRHLRLGNIAPQAILRADLQDSGLAEAVDAVAMAHGIIVATPIYKASYSGLLKCFLDLLPQFAFAGKAVLPLATGGSKAHVLALDYALRPVLQSMGARHVVQAQFVLTDSGPSAEGLRLSADERDALAEAVRHFRSSVTTAPDAALLGHPRPDSDSGVSYTSTKPFSSGERKQRA